jgi:hypothetical protein
MPFGIASSLKLAMAQLNEVQPVASHQIELKSISVCCNTMSKQAKKSNQVICDACKDSFHKSVLVVSADGVLAIEVFQQS